MKADRNNLAGYIDAEMDVTKALLVGAAVRFENYSDFGFTSNYKLDSRLKVADKQGRLAQVLKQFPGEDERIEEVFLATVSRPPSVREKEIAQQYLKQAGSSQKGLEGLMWGLLNANEFQFNQ